MEVKLNKATPELLKIPPASMSGVVFGTHAVYEFLRLHYLKHYFKENYGSEAKQSSP